MRSEYAQDQDHVRTGAPVPPRFTDELLRPFVTATISAVTVIQLLQHPPPVLPALVWGLALAAIVSGAATSFSWTRLPQWARLGLAGSYALISAVLFALVPHTAGVAFVYIAAAVAGEKLTSRRAGFTLVGAMTTLAVGATWYADVVLKVPDQAPWWLALTVGMPLFIGVSRRARLDAVEAAELAAAASVRAAAAEAREAALEERGRIAREIHDVLGHSLSGIAMQLDMADALHEAGRDADANEAVRRARTLAVSGISETRRAVHALREGTLPLPQVLDQLARSNGAEFATEGEPGKVEVEVAQAVVRTAQEAITNAHRHAPGARVHLLLGYQHEFVRVTISDFGAVEAPEPSPGTGMGLVGMRERANLLGGSLQAGPTGPPRNGWTVRLEVPRCPRSDS